MKDSRGPTITPSLNHAPTVPMQRIRQQKARGIPEILLFVHDDQTLAPIAFEPYDLRKHPKWLHIPIATAHPHSTKTFRMRLAYLLAHTTPTPPLALPLDMARAFQLTDPVFASVLDATAQLQAQHTIVKGIMGLGKMAFLFELLHDVQRERGPLLITETMDAVVQQLQHAPTRYLHLGIALAHGLL